MNPTRYTISFSEPQAHLVDIEMRIPAPGDTVTVHYRGSLLDGSLATTRTLQAHDLRQLDIDHLRPVIARHVDLCGRAATPPPSSNAWTA